MAVGVAVSVSKVAVYSRMTEVNSFYARVTADGGTISDFSALRLAVVDYKAVQSLEPSLYTFASGRKAGVQYSLVPADGSGDLSVTQSGDTAMELNANGFWQPVAANVPRYDYVSGRPMLNVEELRTNLLPRYKSFPHSDWTKSGARIEGDPSTKGVNILASYNFTNWNNSGGSTTQNSFTNVDAIRKTGLLTAGKLYYIRVVGTTNDPNLILYDGYLGATKIADLGTGSFNFSGYFYAHSTSSDPTALQFDPSSTSVTTITTFELNEVTGYASPFVDASGNNLMDGYKLVATANNGYIRLATAVTVTAATTYTNSIWIKRVTGTGQAYIIDTNTTDRAITLTTQWQRFEYSAAAGSTSGQIGVKLAVAGDEVLIAHAQLEAGATASSPIGGAEGSAQSRNADVIENTTTTSITSDDFTLMIDLTGIINYSLSGNYYFQLRNSAGTSTIGLITRTSTDNGLRLYAISNNIIQFDYNFGNRSRGSLIIRMLNNTYSLFYNGQKLNLPANSSLRESFTILRLSGVYCSFKIGEFFYIKNALTDQQCIQLTTL